MYTRVSTHPSIQGNQVIYISPYKLLILYGTPPPPTHTHPPQEFCICFRIRCIRNISRRPRMVVIRNGECPVRSGAPRYQCRGRGFVYKYTYSTYNTYYHENFSSLLFFYFFFFSFNNSICLWVREHFVAMIVLYLCIYRVT